MRSPEARRFRVSSFAPFIGRADVRVANSFDVRSRAWAKFFGAVYRGMLSGEHVTGPLGIGSPDGVIAFRPTLDIDTLVFHNASKSWMPGPKPGHDGHLLITNTPSCFRTY